MSLLTFPSNSRWKIATLVALCFDAYSAAVGRFKVDFGIKLGSIGDRWIPNTSPGTKSKQLSHGHYTELIQTKINDDKLP